MDCHTVAFTHWTLVHVPTFYTVCIFVLVPGLRFTHVHALPPLHLLVLTRSHSHCTWFLHGPVPILFLSRSHVHVLFLDTCGFFSYFHLTFTHYCTPLGYTTVPLLFTPRLHLCTLDYTHCTLHRFWILRFTHIHTYTLPTLSRLPAVCIHYHYAHHAPTSAHTVTLGWFTATWVRYTRSGCSHLASTAGSPHHVVPAAHGSHGYVTAVHGSARFTCTSPAVPLTAHGFTTFTRGFTHHYTHWDHVTVLVYTAHTSRTRLPLVHTAPHLTLHSRIPTFTLHAGFRFRAHGFSGWFLVGLGSPPARFTAPFTGHRVYSHGPPGLHHGCTTGLHAPHTHVHWFTRSPAQFCISVHYHHHTATRLDLGSFHQVGLFSPRTPPLSTTFYHGSPRLVTWFYTHTFGLPLHTCTLATTTHTHHTPSRLHLVRYTSLLHVPGSGSPLDHFFTRWSTRFTSPHGYHLWLGSPGFTVHYTHYTSTHTFTKTRLHHVLPVGFHTLLWVRSHTCGYTCHTVHTYCLPHTTYLPLYTGSVLLWLVLHLQFVYTTHTPLVSRFWTTVLTPFHTVLWMRSRWVVLHVRSHRYDTVPHGSGFTTTARFYRFYVHWFTTVYTTPRFTLVRFVGYDPTFVLDGPGLLVYHHLHTGSTRFTTHYLVLTRFWFTHLGSFHCLAGYTPAAHTPHTYCHWVPGSQVHIFSHLHLGLDVYTHYTGFYHTFLHCIPTRYPAHLFPCTTHTHSHCLGSHCTLHHAHSPHFLHTLLHWFTPACTCTGFTVRFVLRSGPLRRSRSPLLPLLTRFSTAFCTVRFRSRAFTVHVHTGSVYGSHSMLTVHRFTARYLGSHATTVLPAHCTTLVLHVLRFCTAPLHAHTLPHTFTPRTTHTVLLFAVPTGFTHTPTRSTVGYDDSYTPGLSPRWTSRLIDSDTRISVYTVYSSYVWDLRLPVAHTVLTFTPHTARSRSYRCVRFTVTVHTIHTILFVTTTGYAVHGCSGCYMVHWFVRYHLHTTWFTFHGSRSGLLPTTHTHTHTLVHSSSHRFAHGSHGLPARLHTGSHCYTPFYVPDSTHYTRTVHCTHTAHHMHGFRFRWLVRSLTHGFSRSRLRYILTVHFVPHARFCTTTAVYGPCHTFTFTHPFLVPHHTLDTHWVHAFTRTPVTTRPAFHILLHATLRYSHTGLFACWVGPRLGSTVRFTTGFTVTIRFHSRFYGYLYTLFAFYTTFSILRSYTPFFRTTVHYLFTFTFTQVHCSCTATHTCTFTTGCRLHLHTHCTASPAVHTPFYHCTWFTMVHTTARFLLWMHVTQFVWFTFTFYSSLCTHFTPRFRVHISFAGSHRWFLRSTGSRSGFPPILDRSRSLVYLLHHHTGSSHYAALPHHSTHLVTGLPLRLPHTTFHGFHHTYGFTVRFCSGWFGSTRSLHLPPRLDRVLFTVTCTTCTTTVYGSRVPAHGYVHHGSFYGSHSPLRYCSSVLRTTMDYTLHHRGSFPLSFTVHIRSWFIPLGLRAFSFSVWITTFYGSLTCGLHAAFYTHAHSLISLLFSAILPHFAWVTPARIHGYAVLHLTVTSLFTRSLHTAHTAHLVVHTCCVQVTHAFSGFLPLYPTHAHTSFTHVTSAHTYRTTCTRWVPTVLHVLYTVPYSARLRFYTILVGSYGFTRSPHTHTTFTPVHILYSSWFYTHSLWFTLPHTPHTVYTHTPHFLHTDFHTTVWVHTRSFLHVHTFHGYTVLYGAFVYGSTPLRFYRHTVPSRVCSFFVSTTPRSDRFHTPDFTGTAFWVGPVSHWLVGVLPLRYVHHGWIPVLHGYLVAVQ